MNNSNYDDEATQLVDSPSMTQETTVPAQQENNPKEEKVQKHNWKQAAAGAASGLLVGSLSTVLMGMTMPDADGEGGGKPVAAGGNSQQGEISQSDWVDDEVPVATEVSDDMSFGEAFAAARNEVGAGGVFEWHGQIYNTYTAEEWNGMTAEERAEFSDHFNWSQIEHSTSDVAQYSTTTSSETGTVAAGDDIEVVSVNHYDGAGQEVIPETAEYVETGADDVDVEVLGVIHEDGMNFGAMDVNGEEVILVDVDGDLEFDYMASDFNNNEIVDENELMDIQGEDLTVDDLGGFVDDPAADMLASDFDSGYTDDASDFGPDYINDAVYEA